MKPSFEDARVVVVLFTIEGCEACEEFKPRFAETARAYTGCIPIVMADANDPRFEQLANRLGVQEVPAMFVLRKPQGVIRVLGNVPDSQINWLMGIAARESTCPTNW